MEPGGGRGVRGRAGGGGFERCDLSDAVFEHCDLQRADFSTAHGFTIDPELNRMKGARFMVDGLPGLLARHGIRIEP
ncbi:MAG: pentapeptide repeat-containing protein [Flavobacteriales bacterium]|nr:pentapeptide repeat-containing protein [Flavobacteriales bacterium]